MASNQPHTKRDVGGQGAKDEKSKKKNKADSTANPPKKPPPAKTSGKT